MVQMEKKMQNARETGALNFSICSLEISGAFKAPPRTLALPPPLTPPPPIPLAGIPVLTVPPLPTVPPPISPLPPMQLTTAAPLLGAAPPPEAEHYSLQSCRFCYGHRHCFSCCHSSLVLCAQGVDKSV